MFIMGAVLLLNAVAMQISGVISVSGFLGNVGVPGILGVWVIDFAVILAMSAVQSLIVDRIERIRLLRYIMLAFIVLTIGIRLLFVVDAPAGLSYSLLYLLKDQQWLFLPAIFWVFANDMFSMSQGKRLFPVIAAFGLAGKLLGLGMSIAAPVLVQLGADRPLVDILWINVAVYAVAILLLRFGLRHNIPAKPKPSNDGIRESLAEGFQFIRTVPMFRFLTIAVLLVVLCDTIVEFHFLFTTDQSFGTQQNFQEFYATFRLVTIVVSILVQSLLTSRLLEKLQIRNAFMIMPVAFLAMTTGALLLPGTASSAVAMLTTQGIRDIDSAAARALRALVPEEKRGRVMLFMENYLTAAGTICGSVIIGIMLLVAQWLQLSAAAPLYLSACIVTAALALGAAWKVRQHYESSLLNWKLTRRKRASDLLSKLDF